MRIPWKPLFLLVPVGLLALAASVEGPAGANHAPPVVEEGDFFFAATGAGDVPRIGGGRLEIRDEDIARYDGMDAAFELFFDGSDVGLGSAVIDAFAFTAFPNSFVLSFTSPLTVPGVGGVDDSDLVEFTATSLGEGSTAGSFRLLLDGSDIGLTQSSEDIDAVEIFDETLHLSTTGSFSVQSGSSQLSGADEDVFRCTGQRGPNSNCELNLSFTFEGGAMELGSAGEDVDALGAMVTAPDSQSEWVLSARGAYSTPSVAGEGGDVFACGSEAQPCGPSPLFHLVFRGYGHGIEGNVTAIAFPGEL